MRKIIQLGLACSFCLLLAVGMAQAANLNEGSAQEHVEGMSNKLVRGVANVATGWIELPVQVVETFQDDGAVKGIFIGPLKGIGMTLVRTLSGVGEIVTFYHPSPGFYDPLLLPGYVWDRE